MKQDQDAPPVSRCERRGAAHSIRRVLGVAIAVVAMPAAAQANAATATDVEPGQEGRSLFSVAAPPSRAGQPGRSGARRSSRRPDRKSAHRRKRCRKGYKKVKTKRGRVVCRRKRKRHATQPAPAPAPTAPTAPPASGKDLGQEILDDTYELTVKFGEEAVNASHGSLPYWYTYLVNRSDCVLLSGDTGRCLIYLWQRDYAAGYGYGGYEASVWRDYYIATRVGDRLYEPKIIQIDFLDPYAWVCSDNPSYGVPPCT